MALKKAITQQNGYNATYWRIDRLQIDWRSKNAQIRLTGYKDKSTREQDVRQSAMDIKSYTVRGVDFNKFFEIPNPDDYPVFDSTVEYAKEDVVSFKDALYKATEKITPNGDNPKASDAWEIAADLRVNRKIAYDYIKNNDVDFTDAKTV